MENEFSIKIEDYDDLKKNYDTLRNDNRSIKEKAKDLVMQNLKLETKLEESNNSYNQLQEMFKTMKDSISESNNGEYKSERDFERDYEIIKCSEYQIDSAKSSEPSDEVPLEQPRSFDHMSE